MCFFMNTGKKKATTEKKRQQWLKVLEVDVPLKKSPHGIILNQLFLLLYKALKEAHPNPFYESMTLY